MLNVIEVGLIAILLLSGCMDSANHPSLPVLIEAGRLAESNPDSAHLLLQTIQNPEQLSEHDFAEWSLISGEIFNRRTDNEKTFLPSLFFERANRFYKQFGSTKQKALIRLHLGRSYQKTGEYDYAMHIFTEVLKDAENWNEYYAAGMICSYMGDIYQTQHLSDKCKEKYNESIYYHTLANNPKSIAYAYAELGFEYLYNEEPEEGLSYILKADSIASLVQDPVQIGKICYYLGVAYSELKKFTDAKQSFVKAFQFAHTKADSIDIYYALSDVHIAAGDFEEARNVLKSELSNYLKDGILRQHYLIEKGKQNFKQALEYLEQYQQTLDSIQTEQKKMHTLEIEQKYNLEHADNLKNKAQLSSQRNLMIALVAIALTFLILFISQLIVRRKNRVIMEQKDALNKADTHITNISKLLHEEKENLQKSEKENRENSATLITHQKRIEKLQKRSFEAKLEMIRNLSPIGKKIIKSVEKVILGGKALSSAEWNTLNELILTSFPSLIDLFNKLPSKLTDAEYRHCLLAFFDLDAKGESTIMNIKPDSVYKQRTRTRSKLQLDDGVNLFEFFKTYCIEHE